MDETADKYQRWLSNVLDSLIHLFRLSRSNASGLGLKGGAGLRRTGMITPLWLADVRRFGNCLILGRTADDYSSDKF